MKYTRVKAVTCALTASVILFGSAAQINAADTPVDLPAAGVGLVLEESSSLSSVQEEAAQSEKAETAEVQSAPEVTHEDIESGLTGVGESAIDVEVADHVEEQQMAAAIDNGVGVANVLDAPVVVNEVPAETEPIAPVDLMMVQAEAAAGKENELKAGEAAASDPGRSAEETEPDKGGAAQNQQASAEASNGAHGDASEEEETQTSDKNASKPSSESSGETNAEESDRKDTEPSTESSGEQSIEPSTESSSEQSTEPSTESSSEQSTEQPGQSAPATEESSESSSESTEQPSENSTETAPSTADPALPGTEQPAAKPSEPAAEQPAETETSSQAAPQSEAATEPAKAPVADAQSSATVTGGTTGHDVVDFAVQFVGNPYVYGGTSLTNGADCSGFVMSVYKNFGVSLPHSSSADRSVGTDVGGLENAQPGDLVCYSGHVGIYIGDNQIVHASTPSTGIKISEADYRTPLAVRRVLN